MKANLHHNIKKSSYHGKTNITMTRSEEANKVTYIKQFPTESREHPRKARTSIFETSNIA
jgi:hypothetical protein